MDASTIALWIKSLGRPYEALVSEGIIPNLPLQELYCGREWLDIEPEDGVELSFAAVSKNLEALYIVLIQVVEGQSIYRGALPPPLTLAMSQADVKASFGLPYEHKGPTKLPLNRSTGGWDAYQLESSVHPNAKLIFKYTQSAQVNTLVFTLSG
jgi:hypothetical protein